jgi:hypothetical protein
VKTVPQIFVRAVKAAEIVERFAKAVLNIVRNVMTISVRTATNAGNVKVEITGVKSAEDAETA